MMGKERTGHSGAKWELGIGIKWIGWGIGTGNRSHFLAETYKHAREAGSPPPYLVSTLLLNTAARTDSAPNPVEHRWMLGISVEQDSALCI
jgi:hypothetical protein